MDHNRDVEVDRIAPRGIDADGAGAALHRDGNRHMDSSGNSRNWGTAGLGGRSSGQAGDGDRGDDGRRHCCLPFHWGSWCGADVVMFFVFNSNRFKRQSFW